MLDAEKDFNLLYNYTANVKHGHNTATENNKLEKLFELNGLIRGDNFENIVNKLPNVGFCEPKHKTTNSDNEDNIKNENSQSSRLCPPEHEKLIILIQEILRIKELNQSMITENDENRRNKEKIMHLEQDLAAFKLGCKAKSDDIKFLTDAHKIEQKSLKKQILEFQQSIMTMTKDKLNLEIELQKLKRQNESLEKTNECIEKEKQELQRKYLIAKKLPESIINYRKMSKTLFNSGEKTINHCRKCKKCVKRDVVNNRGNNKENSLQKQDNGGLVKTEEHKYDSGDSLLSELFFLPSQQPFPDFQLFSNAFKN